MSYEKARIAVDPVIFTIENGSLKVLAHKREKKPFKSELELPGGLLREDEDPLERLNKKVKEMAGKEEIMFKQFGVFTDPERDPRERTISIGYLALVPEDYVKSNDKWIEPKQEMAFDHGEIVDEAIKHLQENLDKKILQQYMPELFPINRLQEVYETVLKKEYDNRNFRRKMLREKVKKTDKKQQNVPHRPARLYKFR